MLSDETLLEIERLMQSVLAELPSHEVIQYVTVTRGYVQLVRVYPERRDYEGHLIERLRKLSMMATNHQKVNVGSELDHLIVTIRDG